MIDNFFENANVKLNCRITKFNTNYLNNRKFNTQGIFLDKGSMDLADFSYYKSHQHHSLAE